MRATLFLLICSATLFAAEEAPEEHAALQIAVQDGYTINYDTISILEYLRFASKICKVNFIYDESDLNFNVTVLSDEPVTEQNVMATLLQVLRIHGLLLLEQDGSLVIHRSAEVSQVAKLVTETGSAGKAPIVTRIFRIKNTKPDSLAAIIRPMISRAAILEASLETRQLILTDITANVEKIAALIENLDSPHALFEIRSFEAMHNRPEFLIELASQIMSPIAQGNPFILVPQTLANSIFIVSTPALVEKAIAVFTSLDTVPKMEILADRNLKGENIFVYKVLNRTGIDVLKGLTSLAANLQSSGVLDPDLMATIENAKWISETNSILFVGTPASIAKTKEFLTALDAQASGDLGRPSFFVYKPQSRSAEEVEKSILEIAHNLKEFKGADLSLIESIESVKLNSATNTLVFSGEEKNFPQVKELLETIDGVKGKPSGKNSFYLYKIQQTSETDIESALKNFAGTLNQSNVSEVSLVDAINNMKYIKETNSLLFTGPEIALKRLQEIVPAFDLGDIPASSQFYIYKPVYQSGEQLTASLKDLTTQLKSDRFSDPALLRTLQSMKWVKATNSLMFTGDPASIKKLENLIGTFDDLEKTEKVFFLYQPKFASRDKTENYLNQISQNLSKKGGNQLLVDTIRTNKWIPESQSFMFSGNNTVLTQLKELLASFDTSETASKPGYYIYKIQYTTGDQIEEELDNLAKNFKASGVQDTKVLDVISKIRYVKETNSLLLTGDSNAIEEVKKIIAQYDYPLAAGGIPNDFFMYKPQSLPAAQIQQTLQDIAANLKKANLVDPSFLTTIGTSKYVEATNSLIFTGNSETLLKVQTLIKEVDIPASAHTPIQQLGKSSFLLYKLKNAGGPQIITSLKNMTMDLKKTGSGDKDFVNALNTAKYIKESNSLLFTGHEMALQKIQELVEKLDVAGYGQGKTEAPVGVYGNFFVYKPLSLSGQDLITILNDFVDNLRTSGLNDPDLFATVGTMRFMEQTNSVVFTGTPKGIDEVKTLLTQFDIPSNLQQGGPHGPLEPSIQAIENTNFLVYKLQFHKGDEIQSALSQIGKDLLASAAPVNKNLLNSINSIQWLEVTNSLLTSGDQETLTRLRELIKNLDIPLKQVFIEMLVVETTLTNALNFGLQWGGNYKYRNKFAATSSNTMPPNSGNTFSSPFPGLNSVSPTSTPNISSLPNSGSALPGTGIGAFDLGIIGEVIRHNGQSFLTLASLMSALQSDDETSIVMTPKVLTQDGRTSVIFQGSNIPFAGSFVQNTGTNTVNSTNIEYRDVGLSLTITPVLGNSDIVTLDINLDRSQALTDINNQVLNPGTNNVNGIVTSKTTMQTTVHVPDNNFLILSGMVNNSSVKSKAGVPCLGGLPLIGAAFSKSNDTQSNTNIVIFIRPHILNSLEDMRQISSDQEDFFRDQAGTPFLQHNYNEAMELIKTVDDE